jgi:hypothetical protein
MEHIITCKYVQAPRLTWDYKPPRVNQSTFRQVVLRN